MEGFSVKIVSNEIIYQYQNWWHQIFFEHWKQTICKCHWPLAIIQHLFTFSHVNSFYWSAADDNATVNARFMHWNTSVQIRHWQILDQNVNKLFCSFVLSVQININVSHRIMSLRCLSNILYKYSPIWINILN